MTSQKLQNIEASQSFGIFCLRCFFRIRPISRFTSKFSLKNYFFHSEQWLAQNGQFVTHSVRLTTHSVALEIQNSR